MIEPVNERKKNDMKDNVAIVIVGKYCNKSQVIKHHRLWNNMLPHKDMHSEPRQSDTLLFRYATRHPL